jgi:hypothetical protein
MWEAKWSMRGRAAEDWHMVRLDTAKPWSAANVEIRNRREWLREVNRGNQYRQGRNGEYAR